MAVQEADEARRVAEDAAAGQAAALAATKRRADTYREENRVRSALLPTRLTLRCCRCCKSISCGPAEPEAQGVRADAVGLPMTRLYRCAQALLSNYDEWLRTLVSTLAAALPRP